MIVYTINLIFTTIFNFLSRILGNKNISNAFLLFSILIASFVAGVRYGVGTDFFTYEQWFKHYLFYPVSWNNFLDIGFVLLIKVLQIFTNNPQYLFLVSALITYIFVMTFIKQNTALYDLGFFLFITLYFYYSSFNIMRQWIAISIFLYALKFAFNKNFIKYLIYILLASSFHISALLTLPVYYVFKVKISVKNIFILFIISFLVATNFQKLILNIANILPIIGVERYTSYFDSSFATSGGGGWAYFIILVVTLLFMFIYKEKYTSVNKFGEMHFSLIILATVFSFFAPFNMIFSRVQLYLMPIIIVCIPNLVNIQKPKERILISIVVIIVCTLYMYRALLINGGEPLPYSSILF